MTPCHTSPYSRVLIYVLALIPHFSPMLDTIKAIQTPEGVELEVRLAGHAPRGLAWLVDYMLCAVVLTTLSPVIMLLGEVGKGVLLIVIFVLWWFYDLFFEVLWDGATPGKKLLGIKVVHDDGTPVGWRASLARNLLRPADFLPFAYLFGFASTVLNKDFKRLGDIAAGTIVVYKQSAQIAHELPVENPQKPPLRLTLEDQQVLLHYAERTDSLSTDRLHELANILEPITGKKNAEAQQTLVAYANWIVGRR